MKKYRFSYEAFSKVVTSVCYQRGISIESLSAKIGYSASNIYHILKGKYAIKLDIYLAIADVLDLNLTYGLVETTWKGVDVDDDC